MKATATRLADGRDLIYFDADETVVRDAIDRRRLDARFACSELRYDATMDEWVAVAAHRQDRTHLPADDDCPLCPSGDGGLSEIPANDYEVVVFENRFPSFAAEPSADPMALAAPGLLDRRPSAGRCEVVCFAADHDLSFGQLPAARVRLIIDALAARTTALSAWPGVEQVFCFENRGEEIGVTLRHPHGQIYAYPFVTPSTTRMLAVAGRHQERTGRNLFADVLRAEQDAGERVVATRDHWTAFVPSASRWPLEIHLYPHRQVADLAALAPDEREDLATLQLEVLRRLDAVFGVAMPYVAAWHQAPVRHGRDLGYLHLRVFSCRRRPTKLKFLAGSEAAMGAFVNDVPPETAAQMLRDAPVSPCA